MFDPFLTEKQILRKLGGDKIPSKVFTYDGNAEETQEIGGITYAKIADTAPDLHNVTKAVYTAPNGSTIEFPAEKLTVDDIEIQGEIIGQRITASLGGQTAAVIILDQSDLWVYAQPGFGYCSYVEFDETIVPIDQKYLPGVCLPVVELSTAFSPGTVIDGEDQKKLWDAYKNGAPTVIVCDISIGNVSYQNARMVWSVAKLIGDVAANVFVASVGRTMLMIYYVAVVGETEGAWNCTVQ